MKLDSVMLTVLKDKGKMVSKRVETMEATQEFSSICVKHLLDPFILTTDVLQFLGMETNTQTLGNTNLQFETIICVNKLFCYITIALKLHF